MANPIDGGFGAVIRSNTPINTEIVNAALGDLWNPILNHIDERLSKNENIFASIQSDVEEYNEFDILPRYVDNNFFSRKA